MTGNAPLIGDCAWRYLGMETLLTVVGILVSIAAWWTGIKKIEAGRFYKTVVSVADLATLGVTIWLLGRLGIIVAVVANVLALLISSVYLAAQKQSILTSAAVNGPGNATRADMEQLHAQLRLEDAFRAIGPIEEAQLILTLSQRGRTTAEITIIAPVVAKLAQIYHYPLQDMAVRFDAVLRVYGMTADHSTEAANAIVAAVKISVGTFADLLDAYIVGGGGQVPTG
jgi:hypothetical protein